MQRLARQLTTSAVSLRALTPAMTAPNGANVPRFEVSDRVQAEMSRGAPFALLQRPSLRWLRTRRVDCLLPGVGLHAQR
jgi:hypothetical protein